MTIKQTLFTSAIAFLGLAQCAFAQTVLQSNLRSDFLNHSTAIADSDSMDNIYFAGRRHQPSITGSSHPSNLFVEKYDQNNNMVWSIETNYTNVNQHNVELTDMVVNKFGDVFIGGIFRGSDLTIGNKTYIGKGSGLYEMFIAKISTAGFVQWIKGPDVIHDPQFNHNSIGSLTLNPNGNVFITGAHRRDLEFASITLSGDVTNTTLDKMPRMFYGEIDGDGNFLWLKNTHELWGNNPTASAHFPDVSISPQGNIWTLKGLDSASVFGQDTIFSSSGKDASDNYAIVKLNAEGEYINHAIIQSEIQFARAIHADMCDNAVVLGVYRDSVKINDTTTTGSSSFNTFLYRLDSDMNVLFSKNYHTADVASGQQVVANEYNEIFLTIEHNQPLPAPISSNPTGMDIAVIKLDSTGNYLWHQLVEAVNNGIPRSRSLRLNHNGYPLLAGNMHGSATIGSQQHTSTQGHAFYALFADDSIPTYNKPCQSGLYVNYFQSNESILRVYPNPTTGAIHFDFPQEIHETIDVQCINTLGQVVLSTKMHSANNSIDATKLPPGAYTIRFPRGNYPSTRIIKL